MNNSGGELISLDPQISLSDNVALTGIQKKVWRAAFILILSAGFWLAATGYRHGLPAIDYGDEVTIWTMGRAYIDPSWNLYQPQYPPGILIVSGLVQQFQIALGDPYINVSVTVQVMRMMSVIAYVVMLALAMLLARRFAGPIAGISAGLFLAPLPLATDLAKLSTNNLWTSAWLIAAVITGIEGWTRQSLRWIAGSLLLAFIGTLFKWQDAAALGMSGLALLSLWPNHKRRMVIAFLLYLAIVVILSYWVIYVHHALEGEVYVPGVASKPPTLYQILVNLQEMTTNITPALIYAFLPSLALIISAWPRFRRRLHRQMGLWTLPCIIFVYTIIISFNGAPVFSRHYLPILPLFAVIAGVGMALVSDLLQIAARRTHPPRVYPALGGLAVVFIAIPVGQMTFQSYRSGLEASLPDRRSALIEWARTTVDGPILVTNSELANVLQPLYGYRGPRLVAPFNPNGSVQVKAEDVDQKIVDEQNIRYLITSTDFKTDKLRTDLTPLLRYAPGHTRGNAWLVSYIGPLPTVLPQPAAVFGKQVALRGYTLSKSSACPDDTVKFKMLWSPVELPQRNYSTYLHLYNTKYGESNLTPDMPLGSPQRPTSNWIYPGEILIDPEQTVTVPSNIQFGTYDIWLGVYDPLGNERLVLPGHSDHFVLGTLEIKQCGI